MGANLSTIEYEARKIFAEDLLLYNIYGGDGWKKACETVKRLLLLDENNYPTAITVVLERAIEWQIDEQGNNEYLNTLCELLGGIAYSLFELGIIK